MRTSLIQRLQELDSVVGQLRAELVALERHVTGLRPAKAVAAKPSVEYLRAYA